MLFAGRGRTTGHANGQPGGAGQRGTVGNEVLFAIEVMIGLKDFSE